MWALIKIKTQSNSLVTPTGWRLFAAEQALMLEVWRQLLAPAPYFLILWNKTSTFVSLFVCFLHSFFSSFLLHPIFLSFLPAFISPIYFPPHFLPPSLLCLILFLPLKCKCLVYVVIWTSMLPFHLSLLLLSFLVYFFHLLSFPSLHLSVFFFPSFCLSFSPSTLLLFLPFLSPSSWTPQ